MAAARGFADGDATTLGISRQALWARFSETPEPLGYVPSIIPPWTSPSVPAFGALELDPVAIRVLAGGKTLEWRAA